MTAKELFEKYNNGKEVIVWRGEDDFSPLLPFIILDTQYQLFSKYIKPFDCKQEVKKIRSHWLKAYNDFNKSFFSVYSPEEKDYFIELMDDFAEYIEHDVFIAGVQISNCLTMYPIEMQKVLSACLLCNALAQASQIVWGAVHRTAYGKPRYNPYIDGIISGSYKFMNAIHTLPESIKCGNNEQTALAVQVLCKKCVRWLDTKKDKRVGQDNLS